MARAERLPYLEASADIQGEYRYHLRRVWRRMKDADMARTRNVAFVMLNPSTADGQRDDATIRRCVGFAQTWGYESLDVVNVAACHFPLSPCKQVVAEVARCDGFVPRPQGATT